MCIYIYICLQTNSCAYLIHSVHAHSTWNYTENQKFVARYGPVSSGSAKCYSEPSTCARTILIYRNAS